jgi:hypothetical protein
VFEDDNYESAGLSAPKKSAYSSSGGGGSTGSNNNNNNSGGKGSGGHGSFLESRFVTDDSDSDSNTGLYSGGRPQDGDSTLGKLVEKAGDVTGIESLAEKGAKMRRSSREQNQRHDSDYDSFP